MLEYRRWLLRPSVNGYRYPREVEFVTKLGEIQRLRVPGGWVILTIHKTILYDRAVAQSEAVCYVPDPNQEWHLEAEK